MDGAFLFCVHAVNIVTGPLLHVMNNYSCRSFVPSLPIRLQYLLINMNIVVSPLLRDSKTNVNSVVNCYILIMLIIKLISSHFGYSIAMAANTPIPERYQFFQNSDSRHKIFHGGNCSGVAVHDNGTIYASDWTNNTIRVFQPDGEETQIGRNNCIYHPCGIALIGNTIYVVSHSGHIEMYSSTDGRFIGEFGSKGNGAGQLSHPYGICTDGKGRVLVADYDNNRIQIFTSQGVFIMSIGCSTGPCDVAVDPEGNIHAVLYSNNHIAKYSEDGNLIDTYNLGGRLQRPTAIYIDGEGYRLIGTNNRIVHFIPATYDCREPPLNQLPDAAVDVHVTDPSGKCLFTKPVGDMCAVTVNGDGIVHVAQYYYNGVAIYEIPNAAGCV